MQGFLEVVSILTIAVYVALMAIACIQASAGSDFEQTLHLIDRVTGPMVGLIAVAVGRRAVMGWLTRARP